MSNIVEFPGKPPSIAPFLRIGYSGYKKASQLLSEGHLLVDRAVIEAANLKHQKELTQTLGEKGIERVLDPNIAELTTIGRITGSMLRAPWAPEEGILTPDAFKRGTNESIIDQLADVTVEHKFDAVFSPTHVLFDNPAMMSIDCHAASGLRRALDEKGAQSVYVDYPLVMSYAQLRDRDFRKRVIASLHNLPINRVWLRLSGFGADATPAGIERVIACLQDFHVLGVPIILDKVGGLTSLAISAFGACSGFAHGMDGGDRFNGSSWLKEPRKSGGGGGNAKAAFVPALDRRIPVKTLRTIFDSSRRSRALLGCSDQTCCGSIDQMLEHPERHFLKQRKKRVDAISALPLSVRPERFIREQVEPERLKAKAATKLKALDAKTIKTVESSRKRLENMEDTLINIYDSASDRDVAIEAPVHIAAQGISPAQDRGI